jgi:dynein heavy chain
MIDLNTAQTQLDEKEKELKEAMEIYDTAISEKQRLIDEAETCRRKMETASALIHGLSNEKERWTEQSKEFKAQILRLVGDVLICTGFLSYQGPFNQDYRILLGKDWQKLLAERKIAFSNNINVVDYLTNSKQVI